MGIILDGIQYALLVNIGRFDFEEIVRHLFCISLYILIP